MSEPSRERLEWAVGVLNEHGHRVPAEMPAAGWRVVDRPDEGVLTAWSPCWNIHLTPFEAVAIASAYEGEDTARRVVAAIEAKQAKLKAEVDYWRREDGEPMLNAVLPLLRLETVDELLAVARKAAGITEGGND